MGFMAKAGTVVEALPQRQLLAYALQTVAPQFFYYLVLVMYLYFATMRLGLDPALLGTIFLISKVWDAVSDPAVGFLSDRTVSRYGRRRIWLVGSSIPLALCSWALWAPPRFIVESSWEPALALWVGVSALLFFSAYTAFEVPHMSLGAELSMDRVQRNRIFGARQIARTATMLVAYTGGVYVIRNADTARLTSMVVICSLLIVVGILWGARKLPPERPDFQGRGSQNPVRAITDVWSNRHARLLLFVFFIESIGAGGLGVLYPFFIDFVLMLDHPIAMPALLMSHVGAALVSIPVWVRLAGRFEKRRLWLFAMLQSAIGYGMFFLVGEGDWAIAVVSSILTGTAGACASTLGQALKADIIDVDEYQTGERKEGAYFSAWTFVSKLAGGIMVWVVGTSFAAAGFDETLTDQSASLKNVMVWIMAGVPLVGYTVGAALFTRFSLSESEHARIRAALDANSPLHPPTGAH